jgi:N-acetylglutamate synthase-like GNAT family acetyltransferase
MSGLPIQIVPYRQEHLEGVRRLIVPIQRQEFGIAITYDDQPDLMDIPGFYRKGCGEFWVALNPALDIVGTIALVDIGNRQTALRKMFVHRDCRGQDQGAAALLLSTLTAHARDAGAREIFLGTTSAFHAAHRFYEKNGFQPIDEANLPASFPRMAVDTHFYRLCL